MEKTRFRFWLENKFLLSSTFQFILTQIAKKLQRANICNGFLQEMSNGFRGNRFIIYRNPYIKRDDFFKCKFLIDNLLKFLFFFLLCLKKDLHKRTHELVYIVPQQSQTVFFSVRRTASTTMWASFSCSSISLENVGNPTGDNFLSLPFFLVQHFANFVAF